MADAASKIAIALAELHNGGLTPATKQHGGDLVSSTACGNTWSGTGTSMPLAVLMYSTDPDSEPNIT